MLSKPIHSIRVLVGLMATAGLVACAYSGGGPGHGPHHAGQSAQGGTMGGATAGSQAGCGMAGGGMSGGQGGCAMMGSGQAASHGGMQHMDRDAMCASYRNMQNAPTEQDRQAMMERDMPGMSPEMRQRHMEMMRQQCQ